MKFSSEQIKTLSNELKDILSAKDTEHLKIVRSGQMLYRQNLVHFNQLTNDYLMASVSDVTFAKVKFSLSSIHLNQCSCPSQAICRHQLAVFFQMYSTIDSVSNWVDSWKAVAPSSLDKIKHLQTASTLLTQKNTLPQEPKEWKKFIDTTFRSCFSPTTEEHTLQETWKLYKYQLSIHSPVEREWRQLYDLYTHFYTHYFLNELLKKKPVISMKWRQLLEICLDKLDDSLYKISVQSSFFAFDEFYSLMKEDAAFLLEESSLDKENIRCFRLLWTKLFRKRDDWQQMLEFISTLKATTLTDLAKGLLLLQLKEDGVYELMEQLPLSTLPFLTDWLDIAIAQKDDARLKKLAAIYFEKVKQYLTIPCPAKERDAFSMLVLKKAKQMEVNSKANVFYEQALEATLPYSSLYYLDFLYEAEDYEKWVSYFIYANLSLSSVSRERLKQIDKNYPTGVLALYHREVQRLIAQKNRASYVEATNYLKAMKAVYKKLQKKSQWDYFIGQLLERYKRQRAFLEEVKRSKCLDG